MMPDQTISLYQIYYRDEQLDLLDRLAIPYDNRGVSDPRLEYAVICDIKTRQECSKSTHWGALSWRFTEKSGLSFSSLIQYVEKSPGFDVYYINPSISSDAMYPNIWQQGDARHPGLLELLKTIFKSDAKSLSLFDKLIPSRWNATCHYIMATHEFWKDYTSFVDQLIWPALQDAGLRQRLLSSDADFRKLHNDATFLPFLIERLFTLYMLTQGSSKFRSAKIEVLGGDGVKASHLNKLKAIKDKSIEKKSRAGIDLWIEYRLWIAKNILALSEKQIFDEFSQKHKYYEFLDHHENIPVML